MDGLKITLSAMPDGLTVDLRGKPLLEEAFVFQCPPLDNYMVQHTFTYGNYDTLLHGQFTRRGSRQLMTWQFDTLVMYLGQDTGPRHNPSWVPFPTRDGRDYRTPQWYRDQLTYLHDAGAPFRYKAAFNGAPESRVTNKKNSYAVLTAFSETYKGGEGDAIYFSAVTFSEWRDPEITEGTLDDDSSSSSSKTKGRGLTQTPLTLTLKDSSGAPLIDDPYAGTGAYDKNGARIPAFGDVTLADIAKECYGDPSQWRVIAKANNVRGAAGSTPLTKLYPFSVHGFKEIQVPSLPTPDQPSQGLFDPFGPAG